MGWTFQSLIDDQMKVTAYCHRATCHHHQVLDLENLRDRFGPDAPAMHDDIAPKLRCTKCSGKQVGLIYAPDETEVFGMAAPGVPNPYSKARGG